MEHNNSIYQEEVNFNFPVDLTVQKILDDTKKFRNRSEQCGKRIDDRIIAKYKKRYKSVVFKKDEKVLVRLSSKGGKGTPKRRFVVEGKIIKKSERTENYKLSLVRRGETVQTKLWIGIEDITTLKKDTKQLAKERRDYARRHFLIPLKKSDCMSMLKNQGYKIIFDPSGEWKLSIQCNSIICPLFIWFLQQCKPTPRRSI